MPWEYEQENIQIKDRTKWWWLAFLALFIVMLGIIWAYGRMKPNESLVRAKHILISNSGSMSLEHISSVRTTARADPSK